MNSNLTPKVITDKNGVTTTRWVKRENNSPVTRHLPQVAPLANTPAPLQSVSRMDLLFGLYEAFSEHSDPDTEAGPFLKRMDTDTLRLMSANIMNDNGAVDPGKAFFAAEWVAFFYDDEVYLRELFAYDEAFDEQTSGSFREEVIGKLHRCPEIPSMDDYSMADDETKAEICRLIKLAEQVYDTEPDVPDQDIILGERMRKLMDDNTDRLDEIIGIMKERDTEDPDFVASILNAEVQPVSSGIL